MDLMFCVFHRVLRGSYLRHYLICNAGIMSPTEWLPSKQNFELQFATNNLSHFLLTEP